jgi:hypothetical protein
MAGRFVEHVCRGLYAAKRSLEARLGIGDDNSRIPYRKYVLNSHIHKLLVAQRKQDCISMPVCTLTRRSTVREVAQSGHPSEVAQPSMDAPVNGARRI